MKKNLFYYLFAVICSVALFTHRVVMMMMKKW